jgi:hypothetical protein
MKKAREQASPGFFALAHTAYRISFLFQAKRPDIPIHLSLGGGAIDSVRAGVSLALLRIDFPASPSVDPST